MRVRASGVTRPVGVRYAWADWAQCNLFNSANLPAPTFTKSVQCVR